MMPRHLRVPLALSACLMPLLALGVSPPPASPDAPAPAEPGEPLVILVFSKTAGFRHDSIPAAVDALVALAADRDWTLDHTEDAQAFTDDSLARYHAVVFLSTTGDVLDDEQQGAFERYIAGGHGYVGVHAAADTEYDWAWYGSLVGAYFKTHPAIQDARLTIEDPDHPSTSHLPSEWERRDEWYDYRTNPRLQAADGAPIEAPPDDPSRIRILASMLTSSYEGSGMGEDHPIAWCHEVAGGRAWYTGGGHTVESFAEPEFLLHLAGGIEWAARGDDAPLDTPAAP